MKQGSVDAVGFIMDSVKFFYVHIYVQSLCLSSSNEYIG